jgi:hypothetical protein
VAGHELREQAEHAVGDVLEGEVEDVLVDLPDPLAHRLEQLVEEIGMLAREALEVLAGEREQLRLLERLHGGRARLALDHGQLAEGLPGAQRRHDAVAAVLGGAEHLGRSGQHHVERIGWIVLEEDGGAGRESLAAGQLLQLLELAGVQPLEQWDQGQLVHATPPYPRIGPARPG